VSKDLGLDGWIARQHRKAVANMLLSVSAAGLVKHRAGFGQTVVPVKGSVVASPVPTRRSASITTAESRYQWKK
jgi:glucoamylase